MFSIRIDISSLLYGDLLREFKPSSIIFLSMLKNKTLITLLDAMYHIQATNFLVFVPLPNKNFTFRVFLLPHLLLSLSSSSKLTPPALLELNNTYETLS